MSPQQAAATYETALKRFYGGETLQPRRPLFAVVLLGLGEDGHTASLFPGQPALEEKRRWALAVEGAPPRERGCNPRHARITLTYPALESAAQTVFLVTGAAKREALKRARAGDPGIPAGRLRPAGDLRWFVDRAAAGE
jgi:6-phosphogluconolactonase